ncbi:hypothetical protein DFJ74DRAFT_766257, partial [Hyaloraphidium curvatum]
WRARPTATARCSRPPAPAWSTRASSRTRRRPRSRRPPRRPPPNATTWTTAARTGRACRATPLRRACPIARRATSSPSRAPRGTRRSCPRTHSARAPKRRAIRAGCSHSSLRIYSCCWRPPRRSGGGGGCSWARGGRPPRGTSCARCGGGDYDEVVEGGTVTLGRTWTRSGGARTRFGGLAGREFRSIPRRRPRRRPGRRIQTI